MSKAQIVHPMAMTILVTVKNNFSFCTVESGTGGKPEVVSFHPNTSLAYQKTATPLVVYDIKKVQRNLKQL